MKHLLMLLIVAVCFLQSISGFSQVTDTTNYGFGIWQAWMNGLSVEKYPQINGRLNTTKWRDIEPSPNQWNWQLFDQALSTKTADGLPVIFSVFTKQDAPEWLYSNGVPKVAEKDSKGKVIGYSPYYKDPDYKFYFKRMIDTVRNHLETLPANVRNKIIAVQTAFGSTGDYISYKGIVDPEYQLSNDDFFDLFKEFTTYYFNAYSNTNPKIRLLNNPNKTGQGQTDWLLENAPGGWLKCPAMAKGYQFNFDLDKAEWLWDVMNQPHDGEYLRSRSEIYGPNLSAGWWTKAPYKNMFATLCYDIFWGLEWPNETNDFFLDSKYNDPFNFFNKYSGQKDPVKSTNAMCALRDGLDASNKERFPESQFGIATQYNSSRYTNIAKQYAANGALFEDADAGMSSLDLQNIAAKGTNDVGWRVFSSNFDRFLHQVDANETSVGYWNISSSDPSTMYGKFGRGFDLSNGKDGLYFDVEDLFLANAPLDGKYPVTLEITYLDKGRGSWQLYYDGKKGNASASIKINCNNSGTWKTAVVELSDAYFGNRGLRGSDFYIRNKGSENIIFSIVELSRTQTANLGKNLYAVTSPAFDATCVNSSVKKSFVIGGSGLNGSPISLQKLEGYTYSKDSDGVFSETLSINGYGDHFYQTVYIKFDPQSEKSYNGDIIVSGGGVESIKIPATGSGINSLPQFNPVVTPITCSFDNNAVIALNPTGGVEPVTYNWTATRYFKATTPTINDLKPATYTVTVSASGGCSWQQSFPITQPDRLSLSVSSKKNVSCKNKSDGSVTLKATGGVAPYSYSSDNKNFISSNSFTNLASGHYTFYVKDANGCVKFTNVTINNSQKNCLVGSGEESDDASTLENKDQSDLSIRVFPNPAVQDFHLLLIGKQAEPVEIAVTDLSGKIIFSVKSTTGKTIVFGKDWDSGMYFLIIKRGDSVKYLKLIKAKG